jgi:hypothetical protein
MKTRKRVLVLGGILLLFIFLFSLNSEPEAYAKKWTERQIKEVLESSITGNYQDSGAITLNQHDSKVITDLIGDNPSTIIYGSDTALAYEIIRWPDGKRSFGGIKIHNRYNGWCTWFYENGQTQKEGTLINDKPIGNWFYYSESGKLDSAVNYGHAFKAYFALR